MNDLPENAKMKSKREIRFVLSGEGIKLLMLVNERFLKVFSKKDLRGARYEFTYSYEALHQLGFYVTGASYFTAAKRLRPQFNRLSKKITLLLKLSDSLSAAAGNGRCNGGRLQNN